MAPPQVVLQYIKKSFEKVYCGAKTNWISSASLWNSTTVTTLPSTAMLLLECIDHKYVHMYALHTLIHILIRNEVRGPPSGCMAVGSMAVKNEMDGRRWRWCVQKMKFFGHPNHNVSFDNLSTLIIASNFDSLEQ